MFNARRGPNPPTGADSGFVRLIPYRHQFLHGITGKTPALSKGNLNDARNVGAHDIAEKRRTLSMPMTPQTCSTWRNDLDRLVVAMDRVISGKFLERFGTAPW